MLIKTPLLFELFYLFLLKIKNLIYYLNLFNNKINFLFLMKRGRKAQTVMEFLLTYGWAILVVLIVLSALFYLGVFETETPEVCFIEAPFICKDMIIEDDY